MTGYERLIENLYLPDPKDRHVLAAAIYSKSSIIVTFNLRDFPDEILIPDGLRAQHPDNFLIDLSLDNTEDFLRAFQSLRMRLDKPSVTVEEYIATLRRNQLVQLADFLTPHAAVL